MTKTTSLETRIKSSAVSGILEVLITHPLDLAKTILQNEKGQRRAALQEFMKQPYKGVSSRLTGIVPMRILFWNSITYFKERGYNPILAGILTAMIQTSVDFPIEQVKTQKMLKNNHSILSAFQQPGLVKGFSANLGRNIGFAIVLNCCIDGHDGSYYHGAVGGFFGSLLTQPADSLKTYFQAGNSSPPSHWTMANYWRGWHLRASISLISMNIGWFVFSKVNNILRDCEDIVPSMPCHMLHIFPSWLSDLCTVF